MKIPFRKKKFNYSDLIVIAKLLTKSEPQIFVFDPEGHVKWDTKENDSTESSATKILFNFGKELIRYKSYQLCDFDHIVDFSCKVNVPGFSVANLNLIQSPAGVIRYIYQKEVTKAHFLNFLPTSTLRALMVKVALKLLVRFGMIGPVGKSFQILSRQDPYYKTLLDNLEYDSYSISLGTPGRWRKPVIQLVKDNVAMYYLKVAISPQTNFLVKAEKSNLRRIGAMNLSQFQVPRIVKADLDGALIQSAVKSDGKKRINRLKIEQFYPVKELMIRSMKVDNIKSTIFYTQILDFMNFIRNHSDDRFKKIHFLLRQLQLSISKKAYMPVSFAHGDFTPWNIFAGKHKVTGYDWEMAIQDAPLMYDIFHFVYQAETLVNRNNFDTVELMLEAFFSEPEVSDFIERFKVDLDAHHRLYLLYTISKNIALFTKQDALSHDQELLIQTWGAALEKYTVNANVVKARPQFLSDFQSFLSGRSYAALKFFDISFKQLSPSSDLDLVIAHEEISKVEQFVANYHFVRKYKVVRKSFMTVLQVHFLDNSFLSIDLIHDFIRKGKRYLDANAVLSNARLKGGVKKPNLIHDIEYTQHFYTLNKSNIPLKYQRIFLKQLLENKQDQLYLNIIERKYKMKYNSLLESFSFSTEKYKKVRKYITKKYKSSVLVNLRKRYSYLQDFRADLKQNKGFMLTFSGVDGAGKTTIIEAVRAKFEQTYRKEVVLLRHRPGILPILSALKHGGRKKAEEYAGSHLPRQGKNKSTLSSLVRFSYYYLDYLFGQVYVYFKYILRGKIVIYDRYYYDFINDSKRSNIKLKPNWIKRLFVFIYKPEFNFYLYNDPEVILSRKKELNAQDVQILNYQYSGLFSEFDANKRGIYHQIKNDVKSETIAEIFNIINKVA